MKRAQRQLILVITLISFFISIDSYAQTLEPIDDFRQKIDDVPLVKQVDTLIAVYEEFVHKEPKASLKYLDFAIQISKSTGDELKLAKLLGLKGHHYLTIFQDLSEAETYLLKAVSLAKKIKNDTLLPGLYNRLGGLNFYRGQLDQTITYFEKGEKIALALNMQKETLDFAINISVLHRRKGNEQIAIERLLECIDLHPDDQQLVNIYNNLGGAYSKTQKYDSSIFFYNKALVHCESGENPEKCKLSIWHNMAVVQLRTDQNRAALKSLNAQEELTKNSGNVELYTQLLYNKALAFKRLEVYDSAILELEKVLEPSKKNGLSSELGQAYHLLSTCYKNQLDYKNALFYHEKYTELKDSIYTIEKEKNIEELITKYESEKKEKEIAQLKEEKLEQRLLLKSKQAEFNQRSLTDRLLAKEKENEILQLQGKNELQKVLIEKGEIEKQQQGGQILLLEREKQLKANEAKRQSLIRNGVIIVSILLLIPAIILVIVYQHRAKNKELLHSKTEEINKQKILEVIREHELKAVKANIEGQEKEKKRISRELHDGIAGNLAGIKLMLAKIAGTYKEDQDLKKVVTKLDDTYKEVRTITHQLTPPGMQDASFCQLIDDFLKDVSSEKEFHINFISHPKKDLDKLSDEVKVEVYRVIQELIINIIKHAKTAHVEVQLVKNEGELNLLVEDNGVGFDTKKAGRGIGLSNIRSRVVKLNGSIDIDSTVGRGTIVNVDIPIIQHQIIEKALS